MIDYKNCMGCGGCAVICSTGAVYMDWNKDGFYQPVVNKDLCINCGMCDKVCPMINKNTNTSLGAYSYQSSNESTLKECASGGFAFDMASKFLKEGEKICNVQYSTELQKPIHCLSTNENELEKTRNSIYLQSYSVDGFKEIVKQKSGVVIGTPCQISALHNILTMKGKRNDFILVDFFCHGVPSYNVWKKYLDSVIEKKGLDNPKIQFRSKKHGWGDFTIKIETEKEIRYIDYVRDKDIFFKVFLENLATNESCYTCPYYGENSVADIRMGDFWGEKYTEDNKGVSALLSYSLNGEKTIKEMKEYGSICIEKMEEILKGQRVEKLEVPACRERLLKSLRGEKSLKEINNTVIFRYKCLRRIKRFFVKG